MSESLKRADEARRERLFYSAQLALKYSGEVMAAMRVRDIDGNSPSIARALGQLQYVTELMLSQGDIPHDIILRGMFDLSHQFGSWTQHQPIAALKNIQDRFNVGEEVPDER